MVAILENLRDTVEKSASATRIKATESFSSYLKVTWRSSSCLVAGFAIVVAITVVILHSDFFTSMNLMQKEPDLGNPLEAARLLLQGKIDLMYDSNYLHGRGYGDFRYFPSMLVIFMPLALIQHDVAFVIFSAINIVLVLRANYLTIKIMKMLNLPISTGLVHVSCLIGVMFMYELILQGQMTAIVIVVMLEAMIRFIDGHDARGALLVGIATFFKPATIILIPMLLLSSRNFKNLLKRAVIMALPLIPDAILFMTIPGLLTKYLAINALYSNITTFNVPRCDLTNFIAGVLEIPRYDVAITYMAAGWIAGIVMIRCKIVDDAKKIAFAFIFSAAVYQCSQFDMWGSQMFLVYPFVIMAGSMIASKRDLLRYKAWFVLYQVPIYATVIAHFIAGAGIDYPTNFMLSAIAAMSTFGFTMSWIPHAFDHARVPVMCSSH